MLYKKVCIWQWQIHQASGNIGYVDGIKSYPNYQYFLKRGYKNQDRKIV